MPRQAISLESVRIVLTNSGPLGKKGFRLVMPRDKNMYLQVLKQGSWEFFDSKFIASVLENAPKESVFVDIGANVGLITLQTVNLIPEKTFDIVCIEPRAEFFQALKYNLREIDLAVDLLNFALSDFEGEAEFFSEATNLGNSSLISEAMPPNGVQNVKKEIVRVRDSLSFFTSLYNYENIVIKIDTQGSDAKIISNIPKNLYSKISGLVLEVWSLKGVKEEEIDMVIELLNTFSVVFIDSKLSKREDLERLKEFWLSESNETRMVYGQRLT